MNQANRQFLFQIFPMLLVLFWSGWVAKALYDRRKKDWRPQSFREMHPDADRRYFWMRQLFGNNESSPLD
jgi:hypothetical protein